MGPNPQFPANLVTFTEEILNGKLHFLCSVVFQNRHLNVRSFHLRYNISLKQMFVNLKALRKSISGVVMILFS